MNPDEFQQREKLSIGPVKYKAARQSRKALPSDFLWLPQALCLVLLVGLPFILSVEGMDKFRAPKDVFAAVAILSVLAVLGSLILLGRLRTGLPSFGWELLFIAGLVYVGAHTLVSSQPAASFSSFLYVFLFACLFFAFRSLAGPRFQRAAWLLAAAALGVSAVLSILQYYGAMPIMRDLEGTVVEGRMNPAGFIGDVNSGGFLFGLASLILLYFVAVETDRRIRLLAAVLLVCNLAGLAFTMTVTAIAGFALGLTLWIALHHWWILRDRSRAGKRLAVFWAILLVASVGAVGVSLRSGLAERLTEVAGQIRAGDWTTATAGRQPVYWLTWRMIRENPVLGRGLDTFGRDFFDFRTETEEGQSVSLIHQPGAFREVHNDYLQVWQELGIAGLGILAALILLAFWEGVRFLRREKDPRQAYWMGILAIGLVFVAVGCLAFFPLRLSVTAVYVLFLAACLRRLQAPGREIVPTFPPRSLATVSAALLLVAASLYVGYRQIQVWNANRHLGMAVFLLERAASGQFRPDQRRVFADQALGRLERAEAATGRFPEVHNLKGVAYMQLGRYGQAMESYQRAVESIPSPEILTNLAAAHLAREETETAERYLDRALRYDRRYEKARQARRYIEDNRRP